MSADVVIRGGEVVDGTGGPRRRADVAIEGGRIVEVGKVGDRGREEIDASGCIVTPGFIDPHTHLDAQLCWDPAGMPSPLHGVTTVVLGICGFGIAPRVAGAEEYLLRSLEAVEEIPFESTSLGVEFRWSTWGEYLDFLGTQDLAMNVAGLVPHSALRYSVMGERARGQVASPEERDAMVAALHDALEAGAFGFGTSRAPNHVDAYGDPVPSNHADEAELRALVLACRDRVWQVDTRNKFNQGIEPLLAETARYASWTREASARLTWSPLFMHPAFTQWRQLLEQTQELNADVVVAPQVLPVAIAVSVRFDDRDRSAVARAFLLGDQLRGFGELSLDDRLARVRTGELRGSLRGIDGAMITESPSRPDLVGTELGAAAEAIGTTAADLLCDLLQADDLATEVSLPAFNEDGPGVAEMIMHPCTMLGAGDAGAHVRSATGYAYPTNLLTTYVRDRELVPLELAVERLTSGPARFFGMTGRGVIAAGHAADVCVIDLDGLALGRVELRSDLPGGSQRLYQAASGYRAVLVNGVRTLADDHPTGERPGIALRAGARASA